ncbi:hypothetical protein CPC16_006012 [Podila verticillata]|nr:hypothetical protein BGZ59_006176 [Podila verticillata]KAF9395933.1 hypothetical protein CPC16_006012 [Podila verticillata]KAI9236707.1 MAG: THO complex subunit 1 transcription elongation factor-domain-containing protein [Podila humilis]
MLPVPTFAPLLDTADAITQILTQSEESMDIVEATTTESQRTKDITRYDAAIKSVLVPTLERYKPMEQASLLEAAFKLKLLTAQDRLGTRIGDLKLALFPCLDLLLRCSELGFCDQSAPLNTIEEVLEFQTVDNSECIYGYLESRVQRLTANMVSVKGKGLTLLRLCNELLRRLSKAKNTVFCGRILMLLSNVFPLGERSGVNLKGDYNVDNVTPIESDDVSVVPDLTPTASSSSLDDNGQIPAAESMDVDEVADGQTATKADSDFYKEFWGLQRYFNNPTTLANSPDNMSKLKKGVEDTLARFSEVVRDERRRRPSLETSDDKSLEQSIQSADHPTRSKRKHDQFQTEDILPTIHFPKFLTSPQLLRLEIVDPYFRKHILVQFLIIIQCLQTHNAPTKEMWATLSTPNKVFQPQWMLDEGDNKWAEEIKPKIFKALETTGVDTKDPTFVSTMLSAVEREKDWFKWKAESCQNFEKPRVPAEDVEAAKVKRQKLDDAMAPLKQKLGCATLSALWDEIEEQTFGDDSSFGTFQPPGEITSYMSTVQHLQKREENMRRLQPKSAPSEEESVEIEKARLWRALRVGAENYLHIYGAQAVDTKYTIKNLIVDIKKDEAEEDAIFANGGFPLPKVEEIVPPKIEEATPAAADKVETPAEEDIATPKTDGTETPIQEEKDAVDSPVTKDEADILTPTPTPMEQDE